MTYIGKRPHSPKATQLLTVVFTPRKYLQASICARSIESLYVNPQISDPNVSMGVTMASNNLKNSVQQKYPNGIWYSLMANKFIIQ